LDILIIEDNKTYQKAIKYYLEKNLLFVNCKIISSFSELKNQQKNYDLYICDYNLEDAPNGEHIKQLISQKKDVIVLTKYENVSDFIRNNVLEFILKEDHSMLDYLVKFIKRIIKNKNIYVLVVDDSLLIRKHITNILSKLKFNIIEAHDGEYAIKLLQKNQIDIVITDLLMPNLNGNDLIKHIRKKYTMSELPIIVISSQDEKKEFIKSLKLGANDFLKKPFLKDELVLRIHNILDLYDSYKKVNKKLQIDSLTNVYNRYYLEHHLEKVFNLYENKTIAMLDIDFFKKINDTYGHQYGDKILEHFAKTIKSVVRKSDIVIRYGGEEFLIFFPNTTKKEALIILLKIKRRLQECDYNYTFSAGISDEGSSLPEMIKIADERLYKAKKEGRDRIIIE